MPDDIDEVTLNVLLAEGLDLPTALEASRRDSADPPSGGGSSQAALWIALAIVAALSAALLLL